jgi:hypothetical protein
VATPLLLIAWLGGEAFSAGFSYFVVHRHRRKAWFTGVVAHLFPVTWYLIVQGEHIWMGLPGPSWVPLATAWLVGLIVQLMAGWGGSKVAKAIDLSEPEDH